MNYGRLLLGFVTMLLIQLNMDTTMAQAIDVQFSTNLDCAGSGQYCATIEIRSADGTALMIGTSSAKFSFNTAALQYSSYQSDNFDDQNMCAFGGAFAPYQAHNPTVVGSDVNITTVLQVIGQGCPLVDANWTPFGTVCFDVLDDTQTPDLAFDQPNTNFNDGTTNGSTWTQGSFGDTGASESLVCATGTPNPRLVEVNTDTDLITIQNFGDAAVDLTDYQFCSLFSYGPLSSFTVVSGSLNLAPGATVTISGFALNDAGADLGLYVPSPTFNDPNDMVDFTQWGSSGNGRESVAVAKGIWTAGDFIDAGTPYSYIGDGTQNGLDFWVGVDCEGTPGGTALPGTACDDGDATTGDDTWQADCTCVGEVLDCEGTPGGTATVGTACDDGDATTGDDTWQADCTCVGEALDCEGTPGGTAIVGTACDDGDPDTSNDTWDASCNCIGQATDCEGTPGGTALPGTACDDGDATTGNDTWGTDCVCAGEALDCEGTPGGTALPGTACDDGDAGTLDDEWQADCTCVGIPCDADAGDADAPATTACSDGSDMANLEVISYTTPAVLPTADYVSVFIVTMGDSTIIGSTDNGVFDFSQPNPYDGTALPLQTYCFTNFVYDTTELNVITSNALVQSVIPVTGGETLGELLDVIFGTNPANPPTVDGVLQLLGLASQLVGFTPCVGVEDNPHCIELVSCAATDCEGTPGGTALPGTACDDGDATTGNDTWQTDCTCAGELIDCEGVPGGTALEGAACDDGDANTVNDTWDANCTCAGVAEDCEGTPGGTALPGTACDDGDATTGNDVYQTDCTCAGELIDCEGVPGGTAVEGAACDDGDATTGNDTWDANCNCVGQPLDCEGTPGGTAVEGTACDDGDATTGNDTWDANCDCVGEALDCEGTPGGTVLPGTACDDGDATTGNDVYQADCSCAGELIDCEGVVGGSALPGTACDDGDANTVGDVYDSNCNCAGSETDCEGTPGGSALPGTACDDGDATTGNDVYQADCSCAGELIDCEGTPGGSALPGTACDDGDATTENDEYQTDCSCAGTPIASCAANAGVPDAPATSACLSGVDAANLEVTSFSTTPSGATDYAFVITAPADINGDEFIIGVSEDGVFDFSGEDPLNPGNPYAAGEYCFSGFTYNQAELDVITNNPTVQGLLTGLAGGESLAEVLALINGSAFGPVTIQGVLDVLDLAGGFIGFTPCVDISDTPYCITVGECDCEGVVDGSATEGTACDDGNANTINDAYDADCNCVGEAQLDCEGVAGGSALPGTSCDDGNSSTVMDTWDLNCNCVGVVVDCEGTAGGTALPGTPCDDGDATTGNDTWGSDCSCAGELIDCEGVVGGSALPGTACDDGDAATGNDVYDSNCNCAGVALDCEGVPGGSAIAGSPCDDGDAGTLDDVYQTDCSCAGTPIGTCSASGGVPVPPATSACNSGVDAADLEVTNFTQLPVGPDYVFVITAPADINGDEFIIAVTEDGVFDFSSEDPLNPGNSLADGEYCFTGFSYNQDELDQITGNPSVQLILPTLQGGESLSEVLGLINNSALGPVTIQGVLDVLELAGGIIGFTPCVGVSGAPYCVTVGECDCEGVVGGSATVGTSCNDGDPTTGNDMYQSDCSCAGTLLPEDCEGVPGGSATVGTSCDDGNAATVDDVYQSDCSCAGTLLPEDCEGVPGGSATVGTSCDDGNAATVDDVYQSDCSCAGTLLPEDCEGVPGGSATVGTSCDDGDATTINDVYQSDCSCAGDPIPDEDCLGVPGGTALPGTACDDGDATTGDDTWGSDCTCAGLALDCLGVPGGSALPGTPCNDFNSATEDDTFQSDCTCVGTPVNDDPTVSNFSFTVGLATATAEFNVLDESGATDPDGDALTLTSVSDPGSAVGTVSFLADGSFVFTFNPAFAGNSVTFNFTVSDGNGGTASGTFTLLRTACEAEAGTLVFGNPLVCNGEFIDVSATGYNDAAGFTQAYVLTQGGNYTIVEISTDGSFAPPPAGDYCIHAFNYENANAPVLPAVGESASLILSQADACFDLDPFACTSITVLDPLGMTGETFCDPAFPGGYFISLTITGGYPAYANSGNYDLNFPADAPWNPDTQSASALIGPIPNSAPIFSVDIDSDGNNCELGPFLFSGFCDTPCDPMAGTMTTELQVVCSGQSANVQASGAVVDPNFSEVQTYVLHDGTDAVLGNVLAVSSSGSFSIGGLDANTVYYIASVVGPNDGTGSPILGDDCTEVSNGTPVVFLNPITFEYTYSCNEETGEYQATVKIYGGYPEFNVGASYTVEGVLNDVVASSEVSGSVYADFTIGPATPGLNFAVTATDEYSCSGNMISEIIDCKPVTPIELLSFEGDVLNEGNLLKWVTATEFENDYFTLLRSVDGEKFDAIAEVEGAGTSTVSHAYSFMDKDAPEGVSYYRLDQTDYDGTTVSSHVISLIRGDVRFGFENISPVPALDVLSVSFTASELSQARMEIRDVSGKLVETGLVNTVRGLNDFQLDVSSYASGVYFMSLNNGVDVATIKFVKE